MKRGIVAIFLLGLSAAACGSDDDASSSSGGGAAALQSCQAYCDASASCGDYASADECKSSECEGLEQSSGKCATDVKAFYDCQKSASDVCMPDCTAEGQAYLSSCS